MKIVNILLLSVLLLNWIPFFDKNEFRFYKNFELEKLHELVYINYYVKKEKQKEMLLVLNFLCKKGLIQTSLSCYNLALIHLENKDYPLAKKTIQFARKIDPSDLLYKSLEFQILYTGFYSDILKDKSYFEELNSIKNISTINYSLEYKKEKFKNHPLAHIWDLYSARESSKNELTKSWVNFQTELKHSSTSKIQSSFIKFLNLLKEQEKKSQYKNEFQILREAVYLLIINEKEYVNHPILNQEYVNIFGQPKSFQL